MWQVVPLLVCVTVGYYITRRKVTVVRQYNESYNDVIYSGNVVLLCACTHEDEDYVWIYDGSIIYVIGPEDEYYFKYDKAKIVECAAIRPNENSTLGFLIIVTDTGDKYIIKYKDDTFLITDANDLKYKILSIGYAALYSDDEYITSDTFVSHVGQRTLRTAKYDYNIDLEVY